LNHLNFMSEREEQLLLCEWNDTRRQYQKDQCIHQLFEQKVDLTPESVALICSKESPDDTEVESLTYRELNNRANQLAHFLYNTGITTVPRVGLCVQRSLDMVVGLLGILKAGGTYVPIDPNYPLERLKFIAEDAGLEVVLTQAYFAQRIEGLFSACVSIVAFCEGSLVLREKIVIGKNIENQCQPGTISHLKAENIPVSLTGVTPSSLAYIIYTSGSTGMPKGVMVEHRGVVRLIDNSDYLPASKDSVVLQHISIAFDVAVHEILAPLANGGKLVVYYGKNHDVKRIAAAIRRYGVNTLSLSASLLPALVDEYRTQPLPLKYLAVGGDVVSAYYVEKLYQYADSLTIINAYGPTENTVSSSFYPIPRTVRAGDRLPIGKPIAQSKVYVLNDELLPQPMGVIGELYVGGDGVARGYLNNPALTQEKFIKNPFNHDDYQRLFKTGDLARWLADGNLEFIGRTDTQVKIRGYRVELGEIEKQLLQHPKVVNCAVLTFNDTLGEKYLVAYVVLDAVALSDETNKNFSHRLSAYLSRVLPDYMLPRAYIVLDKFPLTSNGKVDRSSLPEPSRDFYQSAEYRAPETRFELQLVDIWADLLGFQVCDISVTDHFFRLGGHSLLASRLVNAIYQQLDIELPLTTIFEKPTLFELANELAHHQIATEKLLLEPVDRAQVIPLSFAQQRLWFLANLEGSSAHYNIPLALRFCGKLQKSALIKSINAIVDRHEVLRTRVVDNAGIPCQEVEDGKAFSVAAQTLLKHEDLRQICEREFYQPFDMQTAPLLRAKLIKISSSDHVLVVTMHHSVSDGWSMAIFSQELVALYKFFSARESEGAADKFPLSPLTVQYADYAHWQRQWLSDTILKKQRQYWCEQLRDLPPSLAIPTDYPRPKEKTYNGAAERFLFPHQFLSQVKEIGQQYGATLYMTLLSAWAVVLARHSNQSDIVIGSPVANRNHPQTESLIGFFVNTLVMRIKLEDGRSFAELLSAVRQITLDAYTHQDIPFEYLVEALQPERNTGYSPLFQVMFALQNVPVREYRFADVSLSPVDFDYVVAKFDLTLYLEESGEGLTGVLEYNTDLFKRTTIQKLTDHYQRLLHHVVEHPDVKLSQIPFLSQHEILTQLSWSKKACWRDPLTQRRQPLARGEVYVLGENQEIVPAGVTGEMYYTLNTDVDSNDVDQRRFANPFADTATKSLYRSGLLARWLADGSLEYLGCSAYLQKCQNKAVEVLLRQQPDICDSYVTTQVQTQIKAQTKTKSQYQTVAYLVVNNSGERVDDLALLIKLQRLLRAQSRLYRLPSHAVCLEALPRDQ
ncbi:MAG: amino acid adenylation domain-containing protein, partial [Exilibacterium sp.]